MADEDVTAKRLDEATGEVRRALFWFTSFAAYFVTTVAATTHEQLLRGTAVRLPILNVDLPIVGFYVIGPILFLALHAYLLFLLYQLSRCVRHAFDRRPARADEPPAGPSYPLTQYLLGGLGRFRLIAGVLIWIAVIVVPIVALVFVQIRFLPYHAPRITAFHQLLVLFDVVMLVTMWSLTIRGLGTRSRRSAVTHSGRLSRPMRHVVGTLGFATLGLFAVVAVLFSWTIATLPDDQPTEPVGYVVDASNDPQGQKPRGIDPCTVDPDELRPLALQAYAASPSDPDDGALPESCSWWQPWVEVRPVPPFDGAPQRRMRCLSYLLFEAPTTPLDMRRNLVVRGKSFAPDGKAPAQRIGGGFDLRGRDLRFADFTGSDLSHADLRGANLFGARFDDAGLASADLGDVPETEFDRCGGFITYDGGGRRYCRTVAAEASFARADLDGARLHKADLREARMREAKLKMADLVEADLSGAVLGVADLPGANLSGAWLDGANLNEARLVGANLDCARARGAHLNAADLSGAGAGQIRLADAQLEEARLVGIYLARADLTLANLAGAYLDGADLRAARLDGVTWQTLDRPPARLNLVDLRGAVTDGDQTLQGLIRDEGLNASKPLIDGEPGEPAPAAHQEALARLLGDRSGGAGAARSSARARGGDRTTYEWLGVLNRIERAWHDSCVIPPYLTKLAEQLLGGACERGSAFSAREWWLLQLAERANHGPEATVNPALGSAGDVAPAAGPAGAATDDPRCVVGPPLTPTGCQPKPWVPIDTPVPSSP